MTSEYGPVERGQARLDDDEGLEVQDPLDVAQGHVQHQADARGQRLEEPDVGGRRGKVDVTHAFTTHLGQRDLRAALLADHATVLHALVFAAQTRPVGNGPEDLRAEQAVAFRLERAVVDRLGLGHFAVRPLTDFFRRSQRDANRLKVGRELCFLLLESKHCVSPVFSSNVSGSRNRSLVFEL